MRNRRLTTRVKYKHPAAVYMKDKWFTGDIENISLKGVYVRIHKPSGVKIGEKAKCEIDLLSGKRIKIKGSAKVVRNENKKGIALYFYSMRLKDLESLRRIVEYNLGDAQKIEDELRELFAAHRTNKVDHGLLKRI